MSDDVSLMRMIGRIYDAAADPAALGALASDLSNEFASDLALVYLIQDPRGKSTDLLLSATASFDDWAHTSYTGYYRKHDVLTRRMIARSGAGVVHGLELADRSTLERTELCADYWPRVGIYHAMGSAFPVAGDQGVVTMTRPRRDREFDDQDKRRLEILMPHLQRAVQIQRRLAAAEQRCALSFEILEKLGLGVIIVEQDCRLVFANAVAQRLLAKPDALDTWRGRLRPRHGTQIAKFERLVRDAALTSLGKGTNSGGIIALLRPEQPPFAALIAPYRAPADVEFAHGRAMVMFFEPRAEAASPEAAIAQMFAISPAETRLVCALLAGRTLAAHAEAVGVTLNTAKTQLRTIFHKTGYHRQADLVRAALANPLVRLAEH